MRLERINWTQAEEYFKLANNRTYYSKAYAKTRDVVIKEYATEVIVGLAIVIIAWNVFKIVRKKKKGLVS